MDGRADGRMENRSPISHLATEGATKMFSYEQILTVKSKLHFDRVSIPS